MSKDVTRLISQFRPEHYELSIEPDATSMTFKGHLILRGQKVGRPSQRLTLHQKGLKISNPKLLKHDNRGDQAIKVSRHNLHNNYDEARLHCAQMLYPGKYTIELDFSGKITRPMNGLYPCFFKDKGESKKLLATQFESHHAREVFPCIDEPDAKATFDLTLTTPTGQTVLANTPIAKQDKVGKKVVTRFETTPKMSSYLLAFVVGDMDYKEAKTKDGVLVRTYATPQNAQFTDFALDVAVKCLEFYNDYFGLSYPLPKCDLIALPDFAAGAMENWGCITFREQCMLVDPANTSLAIKQYVAMVVAHELAHQWFGNLVTMQWWTDLWLNEGFASWIEYLAVDHLFPKWQMWTQFVTDEQQSALRLDALTNTHPIEVPVKHPDEIRTIFDAISYNKGASVIHMLNQYLGETAFRDGLRHYLKQHAYSNTQTIDLWKALEKVSGQPVNSFMQAWTTQPGFPLLRAHQSTTKLELSQQRFYADPTNPHTDHLEWPIAYKPSQAMPEQLLKKFAQNWHLPSGTKPIKLNSGQSGFFRVAYDSMTAAYLADQVSKNMLEPLDRLGLLSDAFETAKAGYAPTIDALNLLQHYDKEDNNAVWDVIAGALGTIRSSMDDDQLRETMKPFTRKLVAKQLDRLGWKATPKESHFDSLLRPTILGMAAVADEPDVVKECLKRFEKMKTPQDLPPDLRSVIYSTAARHGNRQTFDKLLSLHNSSTSSEERTMLVAALTGFKQPDLIKLALGKITSDQVRLQDAAYWVAYSFMNRHAKQTTWQWLTKNWSWLTANLGSDLSFPRFPIYAARSFSDTKFLPKYQKFFEGVMTPVLERAYKQGVETINWQAAWKERDLAAIKEFFQS